MERMDFGEGVGFLNIPEGLTDEQKKAYQDEVKWMMRQQAMELNSLQVIYTPSCGCDGEIGYVLDRYPMSPKIHHRCESCQKYVMACISDPIRFYLKLTDEEYSLEQLREMFITDGPQKEWIERYTKYGSAPV